MLEYTIIFAVCLKYKLFLKYYQYLLVYVIDKTNIFKNILRTHFDDASMRCDVLMKKIINITWFETETETETSLPVYSHTTSVYSDLFSYIKIYSFIFIYLFICIDNDYVITIVVIIIYIYKLLVYLQDYGTLFETKWSLCKKRL